MKARGGSFRMVRRARETAAAFSQRVANTVAKDPAIVGVDFENGRLCRTCAMGCDTDGREITVNYFASGCYNCADAVAERMARYDNEGRILAPRRPS